jgi:hypothetical protein
MSIGAKGAKGGAKKEEKVKNKGAKVAKEAKEGEKAKNKGARGERENKRGNRRKSRRKNCP